MLREYSLDPRFGRCKLADPIVASPSFAAGHRSACAWSRSCTRRVAKPIINFHEFPLYDGSFPPIEMVILGMVHSNRPQFLVDHHFKSQRFANLWWLKQMSTCEVLVRFFKLLILMVRLGKILYSCCC